MRFGGCKRLLSLPNIAEHRAQAQQGNQVELGNTSRSKTPHHPPDWEEGEGRNVGRIQIKNPRRRHSKGLKANPALQSGNVGEQESLGEREDGKKSGIGGERDLRGSRLEYIPSSSEPAGAKPGRGSPQINHRNKSAILVWP